MELVPLVLFVVLVAGCISGPIQLSTGDLADDAAKIQADVQAAAERAGEEAKEAGEELSSELEQRAAELGIPVQDRGGTEEVYFSTSDGVGIQGTFYFAGDPGYSVILLHALGGDRGDWDVFAPKLVERGYEVLSIDLKGHGGSTNIGSYKGFSDSDYLAMVLDVKAAVDFLGDTKIAIIGGSMGANVALRYAAGDPDIVAVVLMSPGEVYRGVTTLDAIEPYGERPILIMASAGDSYPAISSEKLFNSAMGEKERKLYEGTRHGTKLLGDSEVEGDIFDWLGAHFKGQ